MSEQYRCKECGYVLDISDMMCSECGDGFLEPLRLTKGGDGSHWEGCADVHWDCKIAQLTADNARLTAELAEAQRYIRALENEPVRSKSVVKRLRTMCGLPVPEPPEGIK